MYQVRFYKGDYVDRQRAANRDHCVAYVEHHFNSAAGSAGNYAMVIVGSNASNTSKNWAQWYARAVASSFGLGLAQGNGVVVGGFSGRGDGNVKFTDMPAILLEPLFANNPVHAAWIHSEEGQDRLAQILADSIERCFPDGGTVAFSVGHKYKASSPNDRGAAVAGGGTEADFAEIVLNKAAAILVGKRVPAAARPFAVYVNNREVWKFDADPDAVVRFDQLRGILFIDEPGALAPALEVPARLLTRPSAAPGPVRERARRSATTAASRKGSARKRAPKATAAKRAAGTSERSATKKVPRKTRAAKATPTQPASRKAAAAKATGSPPKRPRRTTSHKGSKPRTRAQR